MLNQPLDPPGPPQDSPGLPWTPLDPPMRVPRSSVHGRKLSIRGGGVAGGGLLKHGSRNDLYLMAPSAPAASPRGDRKCSSSSIQPRIAIQAAIQLAQGIGVGWLHCWLSLRLEARAGGCRGPVESGSANSWGCMLPPARPVAHSIKEGPFL